MKYNPRFITRNPVYTAMLANDPLLLFFAWGIVESEPDESLKEGEVAYGGLKKPVIRISDPHDSSHYIIRKNNLEYLKRSNQEDNINIVFMNLYDSACFKKWGFAAGDKVNIVEEKS